MKCLVLAGGAGDRLWPLSRKDYPKQFVNIDSQHSMFQKTIVRNMAFCDEFWVTTAVDYKNIVQAQLDTFPGLKYKCFYEEEGKLTALPLLVGCMLANPDELMLVVAADNFIEGGDYKSTIITGRQLIKEDKLVCVGAKTDDINKGVGLFSTSDNGMIEYLFLSEDKTIDCSNCLLDVGILMGKAGVFVRELAKYNTDLYHSAKKIVEDINIEQKFNIIKKYQVEDIPRRSISEALVTKSSSMYLLEGKFNCNKVANLEALSHIWEDGNCGQNLQNNCNNVSIMNFTDDQLVIGNSIEDLCIVNTVDAIYVSKKGETENIKDIIEKNKHKQYNNVFEHSSVFNAIWGKKETLKIDKNYLVRKITMYSGCGLRSYSNDKRSSNLMVVQGVAGIIIDGIHYRIKAGDSIHIDKGATHKIFNDEYKELVYIETVFGEIQENSHTDKAEVNDMRNDNIVKMSPYCKEIIWGGSKLISKYGKHSTGANIAESWEVSAHPNGLSVVDSGIYKGMNFDTYLKAIGREYLGWKAQFYNRFPLLVKFIDATDKLSVQVHPNDDYALAIENEYGKNEMWYVIEAEPDAYFYCGFKDGVSQTDIENCIKNNTLTDIMNKIYAKKGQTLFIPAGTVHAIGKGLLICEVQQNSDITYRLYDYGRLDKNGRPRHLQVAKGIEVTNRNNKANMVYSNFDKNDNLLCECKYFTVNEHRCNGELKINTNTSSFEILVVVDGSGQLEVDEGAIEFKAGETFFVPAKNRVINIKGNNTILSVRI